MQRKGDISNAIQQIRTVARPQSGHPARFVARSFTQKLVQGSPVRLTQASNAHFKSLGLPTLIDGYLAYQLEPPCTDPYARWCGRGRRSRGPLQQLRTHSNFSTMRCWYWHGFLNLECCRT